VTTVLVVHAEVAQLDAPIRAVTVPSSTAKLDPWTVTLLPPEVGALPSDRPVTIGESYENKLRIVPITDESVMVTPREMPMPLEATQITVVDVDQDVVVHTVPWIRTLGV